MLLSRTVGATPQSYTNDANGNTLTGGGRTNTWDSQNRLVECTINGKTSQFTYGADGLRRRMSVTPTGDGRDHSRKVNLLKPLHVTACIIFLVIGALRLYSGLAYHSYKLIAEGIAATFAGIVFLKMERIRSRK